MILNQSVGRIKKIDTEFQRGIHDGECVWFCREGTKIHGSETETADAKTSTTETGVLHWLFLGFETGIVNIAQGCSITWSLISKKSHGISSI
jgi:hypothetical protein